MTMTATCSPPASSVRPMTSNNIDQSPALMIKSANSPGAYELKCLIPGETAEAIQATLNNRMQLDSFCKRSAGNEYRITTLATDTPELAVFHRVGKFARTKHRVRRYGDEDKVYLERKTRKGHRVRKQRAKLDLEHLSMLSNPDNNGDASEENWFATAIRENSLSPVCAMTCLRRAWFGQSDDGTTRLTMDRQLEAALINEWSFTRHPDTTLITAENVICEFKFVGAMPLMFKQIIEMFSLNPGGFSKYRNSLGCLTGKSSVRETSSDVVLEPKHA